MLPSSYPISIFFAALTGRLHRHLTNALLAKYRDTHVARIDIATRRMHYYRKHDLFVQLPCWRSLRITAPTSGQRYNRIICRYRCRYDYTPYPEMNASTRRFIVLQDWSNSSCSALRGLTGPWTLEEARSHAGVGGPRPSRVFYLSS